MQRRDFPKQSVNGLSVMLAPQALRAATMRLASERAAIQRVSGAAEIAAAASRAKPGDVIVISGGVWKDADILYDAQGKADKHITLRAQTLGKVILRGCSRLRGGGAYLMVDGLWFKDGHVSSDDEVSGAFVAVMEDVLSLYAEP